MLSTLWQESLSLISLQAFYFWSKEKKVTNFTYDLHFFFYNFFHLIILTIVLSEQWMKVEKSLLPLNYSAPCF